MKITVNRKVKQDKKIKYPYLGEVFLKRSGHPDVSKHILIYIMHKNDQKSDITGVVLKVYKDNSKPGDWFYTLKEGSQAIIPEKDISSFKGSITIEQNE